MRQGKRSRSNLTRTLLLRTLASIRRIILAVRTSIDGCLRLPEVASLSAFLLFLGSAGMAQMPPSQGVNNSQSMMDGTMGAPQQVTITIGVRDARGLPLEAPATVRISSHMRGVNRTAATREESAASFVNLLEGPYEVEVRCPGYKTVVDHLDATSGQAFFSAYVYMHPETETESASGPAKGLVLTPKLASEIDKGLAAMRKHQYDGAKKHFEKASQLVPKSSDVAYLQGTAELDMGHTEVARTDFQRAVLLDPTHEKALLSLGELQLQSGDTSGAIATLNKAYAANGAGWRTHYLLANAYAKSGNWQKAEAHAQRAAILAHDKGAPALLFLGDVQSAQGNWDAARLTWERIPTEFPKATEVAEAKKRIATASGEHPAKSTVIAIDPSSAAAVDAELPKSIAERPWAPADIDHKEYPVAADISCNAEEILPRAMRRMKSQLGNFEKFAATEHIEHQEVDKLGEAGPIKSRNFSYIVFVKASKGDSIFLEESRDGGTNISAFPTSLATTGLNSLGVSVLQPENREGFAYQCEGLANVRGEAAWEIRFEEKKNANLDVRRWQRQGTIYNIPIKGRIWVASTSYDVLRVETDLREPVGFLELTLDHLLVDYGPVAFGNGQSKLWLPWSAEMYMELHGKRYHHRHFLTDYLLFGVDTSHKIGSPKNIPKQEAEEPPKPDDKPE